MKIIRLILALLITFSPVQVWAASCSGSVCPSGTCTAIVDPGGTGDYLSINAFNADCTGDLTAGSANQVVTLLSSDSSDDTTDVTLAFTTSAAYKVTFNSLTDTHVNGVWAAGGYIMSGKVTISQNHTVFNGVQFDADTSTNAVYITSVDAVNSTVLNRCIINRTSADSNYAVYVNDTDAIVVLMNTLVYESDFGSGSNGLLLNASTVGLLNCTIGGLATAINHSAGTTTITNSAIFANGTDIDGTTTITYSACDDAECDSGTGNVPWDDNAATWNAAITDYSNLDMSVKDVGSDLYNAGTDLSGSGVTVDLIGTARPQAVTYDIGAFELIVATDIKGCIIQNF